MHHLFSKFDNCNSLNSEHPEQPILSEQSEHRKAWKHCLKSPKNQNYQIRIMQPYSLHILIWYNDLFMDNDFQKHKLS